MLESGWVGAVGQGPELKRLVWESVKKRTPKIAVGGRKGLGTFGTKAGKMYTGYSEQ